MSGPDELDDTSIESDNVDLSLEDEELLAALAADLERVDPMPSFVAELAAAVPSLSRLDAEVATLVDQFPVPVRSVAGEAVDDGQAMLDSLTFQSEALTIIVDLGRVSGVGDDAPSGELPVPAVDVVGASGVSTVEFLTGSGREIRTRAVDGWFLPVEQISGATRVVVKVGDPPNSEVVATDWFLLPTTASDP